MPPVDNTQAFVPPKGSIYFPLQSNAHALVAGPAVKAVRARRKVASLLYEQVLLEAGQISVQTGPRGSATFPSRPDPTGRHRWQTPRGRGHAQAQPFSISIAREATSGVPATGPYATVLHSPSSISWLPTFEPFAEELPAGCEWITFGNPAPNPVASQLADRWRRADTDNSALTRLVPEKFVREKLIDHVSKDLAIGATAGWQVSVDRFHGSVFNARFASDASVTMHGFALPILLPRVSDLDWKDVSKLRKLKALGRLREVLRATEVEASQAAREGDDLEDVLERIFRQKIIAASKGVHEIRSVSATVVGEFIVGSGAGFATMALAALAPLAAGGVGAAVMGGLHVRKLVLERRRRSWIGAYEAIDAAAS